MVNLVDRFATSPHRCTLLRNLVSYRQLLNNNGYTDGIQLVDGSFVEDVENIRGVNPNDIDVFSLLHAPARYLTNQILWTSHGKPFWDQEVVDRVKNRQRFSLDTFGVLIEELSPPTFLQQSIYWYSLFSHQRDTFAWKGFVVVPIDAKDDNDALKRLDDL